MGVEAKTMCFDEFICAEYRLPLSYSLWIYFGRQPNAKYNKTAFCCVKSLTSKICSYQKMLYLMSVFVKSERCTEVKSCVGPKASGTRLIVCLSEERGGTPM